MMLTDKNVADKRGEEAIKKFDITLRDFFRHLLLVVTLKRMALPSACLAFFLLAETTPRASSTFDEWMGQGREREKKVPFLSLRRLIEFHNQWKKRRSNKKGDGDI